MRIFSPLYDRALKWSRHPHAERYLAIEAVTPVLHRVGYWQHFETAHDWFGRYGF